MLWIAIILACYPYLSFLFFFFFGLFFFFFFFAIFQSSASFCPMPCLAFVLHLSLSPMVRTLVWGMTTPAADGNLLGSS